MKHTIDLSREPPAPWLGWILLIVGVGAAVSSLAYRQHRIDVLAEADRLVQARVESQHLQAGPRAVAPSPAETRRRAAGVEARAPWLATLRAIESTAREPVYLRAVTFEPGTGVVRLDAEASSFADALAYATSIDDSAWLHPAWLRSHEEAVDPALGRSVVRFSVVARWNSR